MTDQPQPLDLDAIEARANAATAGPWEIEWDTDDVSDVPFPIGIGPIGYLEHRGDREFADAEFIAAARTDVPALLAEIRRLTAELQQTRTTPGTVYPSIGEAMGAAMAHNARMAAELATTRAARTDPAAVSGA